MTVARLIELLEKAPQDRPVLYSAEPWARGEWDVERVSIHSDESDEAINEVVLS